jgi:spore coat polysaccharide biosynthesis protein SpsF
MPKVVATIEARMGSSRLPGKVLKEAVGKPMLLLLVERARRSKYIDEVVVATTTGEKDNCIADLCRKHGISYFRGSEENVLERVVEAGRTYNAEVSVLLTGDNPLIDPVVIDQHICAFLSAYPYLDYVSNCEVLSFPLGLNLQVVMWKILAETLAFTGEGTFREHVGWYIRRHSEKYRRLDIIAPQGLSNPFLRLTLDYQEDYERITAIFEALYHLKPDFTVADILDFAVQKGWIDT